MTIIKPHITAMSAYAPPLEGRDPDAFTLLDFNERTEPVVDPICEALIAYIQSGRLQMYPSYGDTVAKIAQYVGADPEQVMITNGSDQGIDLIFRSVASEGDEAIIPSPNFAMYSQCAKIENMAIIAPKYTLEGGFPVEEVIDAVTARTKVICVSNPANPSGTMVSVDDILRIAKAAPNAAILVDECYFEYAKVTVIPYVAEYPNLVVTRTFSKTWGLPSLRIGYIVADSAVINALLNVRGPYDINQLAVVAVHAALAQPALTLAYVDEVMQQAKPALEACLARLNITYWPSGGNYVWLFVPQAQALQEKLQAENILVRPKLNAEGALGLRVTVGNLAQTQKVIAVITSFCG